MNTNLRTIRADLSSATINASVTAVAVPFILSRGAALSEIEAATGLSGFDLVRPDFRVPAHIIPKLWEIILSQARPGETPQLEFARAASLAFLDGLAQGAQYARDLREVLMLFVENKRIMSDLVQLELRETEKEAELIHRHPMDTLDHGLSAEVKLALLFRTISEFLDISGRIARIEFCHSANGSPESYESFFKVPVLFEQSNNAIVFPTTALSEPIKTANIELFAFVQNHFQQMRHRIERNKYPVRLAKVHAAIVANAERGDYNRESAAARANMSLRSAQRLAAMHGTSLQSMTDEIRAWNAKELLKNNEMAVEKVAQLVGYNDDRSFRRAFKRWTGQTPSQFRETI